MLFELTQSITAPVDAVVAAFVEPAFYENMEELPTLGRPDVLERHENGGVVHLRVRHRFTGEVSSAVRAVVDPNKFSWVEETTHDTATRRVTFRMLADHYADRFRCSGRYDFEPADGEATTRTCRGDLQVKVPLVGRRVENAILSGLHDHLDREADLVARWIAARGTG